MLTRAESYEAVIDAFRWSVPAHYNIGVDVCDRQDADATAIIYLDQDGTVQRHRFGDLRQQANRLANLLTAHGLGRGDRVAILLPQAPETAVAHIAVYRAGMIAVPLFVLFGPDALAYRLGKSGARALITSADNLDKLAEIRSALPELDLVLSVDGPADGARGFHAALADASDSFVPVKTAADDPAMIIFTSGTTGPPKGALLPHRVLLGHLPGVEFPHSFFPQPDDLFWTPADWAWIGGILDVLLPALHHGRPVLAHRARKFDPEEAFDLMDRFRVRNVFMPPTALKLMRQVDEPRRRFGYDLRTIGSGGETLGAELLDWGRETFGITINEFYGQTECNLVVGNCAEIMPVRPGSMGRAVPGHRVDIIDDAGTPVATGEIGHIAVRRPDPVMFLHYWDDPQATEDKFIGDWLITGDTGRRDEDGYLWFVGRADDVIGSAGYRIGPGEVEDTLLKHPAVAMAAVIGVPDPVRGQAVKAFIVPAPETTPTEALASEIREFVKRRLAAHEYPRQIEFIDTLPMTATGKIKRNELREQE